MPCSDSTAQRSTRPPIPLPALHHRVVPVLIHEPDQYLRWAVELRREDCRCSLQDLLDPPQLDDLLQEAGLAVPLLRPVSAITPNGPHGMLRVVVIAAISGGRFMSGSGVLGWSRS